MKTFEQVLTKTDYEVLKKLAATPEFERFREIIEEYQQQRAYNLMAGVSSENGTEYDELDRCRGGFQLWIRAMGIVDNAVENLKELEKEHDTKAD
jgi:hypothetical protein